MADEVTVAQVDAFAALDLVTSGDSYTILQAARDAEGRDPRLRQEHKSGPAAWPRPG